MDAVGLAGNILTFIDVASRIGAVYLDIRDSRDGETKANSHLNLLARDLEAASKGLQNLEPANQDREICRLAKNCSGYSAELGNALDRLKPSGSSGFRAVWKAVEVHRQKREIQLMNDVLQGYRIQLVLRLQFLLLNNDSELRGVLDEIKEGGMKYSSSCGHVAEGAEAELKETMASFLGGASVKPDAGSKGSALVDRVNKLGFVMQSAPKQLRALRKLHFTSIFAREEFIDEPAKDTFQWLLSCSPHVQDKSGEQVMSTLQEEDRSSEDATHAQRADTSEKLMRFLKTDSRAALISGKAGCGKSTLMKFLAHSKEVEIGLQHWAGERKLIIARVFFWRSTDLLQKSLRGLYQSILFQTIRHCPELVDTLFPGDGGQTEAFIDAVEYPVEELYNAIVRLTSLSSNDTYRFCYFIDGLDEYEGTLQQQLQLARILTGWTSAPIVKIICSSRPNPVYLDIFNDVEALTIHLHNFTSLDIKRFSEDRFATLLDRPRNAEARQACLKLVDIIVDRAEGVFAWANFVVQSLINAALLREDPSKLAKILDECPSELSKLMGSMLERINQNPGTLWRSTVLFYLVLRNPFGQLLNGLVPSWLDELDWLEDLGSAGNDFPFNRPAQRYTEDGIARRIDRVTALLQDYTQGLVDLREHKSIGRPSAYFRYRLDFFHRSVRDYLEGEWLERARKRLAGAGFYPEKELDFYCRVLCAEVKFCPEVGSGGPNWDRLISKGLAELFESGFIWLQSVRIKGHSELWPRNAVLQDLECITYGESPQICRRENGQLGVQLMGSVRAFLGYLRFDPDSAWRWHDLIRDDCSFLHFTAYWFQGGYVKARLESLGGIHAEIRAIEASKLNLLLASSIGTDVASVRYLLEKGWTPYDRVDILPRSQDEDRNHSDLPQSQGTNYAEVWWLVLRDFGFNALKFFQVRREKRYCPEHLDRAWLERFAVIIEAFLRAGADPELRFYLDRTPEHDTVAYEASLALFLEGLRPANWPSLAAHFCNPRPACAAEGEPGSEPSEAVVRAAATQLATVPIRETLKPNSRRVKLCSVNMLLKEPFGILGIGDSKRDRLLPMSFKVRVF